MSVYRVIQQVLAAYIAIVFNHHRKRILQLTIQSLITLHLTIIDLSSLVRKLRMWRACDAQKFNNKRQ